MNTQQVMKSSDLLVELAGAAFRVAEQHDFKGAFIDIEMDLWMAHRATQTRTLSGPAMNPTCRTRPGLAG